MRDALLALCWGAGSGVLAVAAYRYRLAWLAAFALSPLAVAVYLAVPSNDWPEIFQMHHRSAVWSAVMAGVPVVLVADVPTAPDERSRD